MTRPLETAQRIVIKLGSALIFQRSEGTVQLNWMRTLAADVARLIAEGKEVLIVSSGAAALGRNFETRGRQVIMREQALLSSRQAASAIGQPRLMAAFNDAFSQVDIAVAQALLTLDDTEIRKRWLNARATLFELLNLGVVPVINENDTVATSEIRYGDNDRLAARVAQMIGADVLILFSDIDGLYTADPRNNPGAEHISDLNSITAEVRAYAGDANKSAGVGTGGMTTKLDAAEIAWSAGCSTIITAGFHDHPIQRVLDGGRSTTIHANISPHDARMSWLAGHLTPEGAVTIDAGAEKALLGGASLLPVGVTRCSGQFSRGAAIAIHNAAGKVIAKGVTAYSHNEINMIKGLQSGDVSARLGYPARTAIIHRDDMILTSVVKG